MILKPTARDEAIQENLATFLANHGQNTANAFLLGLFSASADESVSTHTYDFSFSSFDQKG